MSFKENGFESKNYLVNNGEILLTDDLDFANVKEPIINPL